MFELLQRWLVRYARSSWAPRRIGTVAAVLALLVAAVVVNAAVAGGGSNSRSRTAAHVHVDATGSPAIFVRDVLLASYSGDVADACAQLTPQALAQLGGAQKCESAVSTSPFDAARVRSAYYWPTVAGDRAVVLTSASNRLFQDSSQVDLVKTGGRWKISCIGYCSGPQPRSRASTGSHVAREPGSHQHARQESAASRSTCEAHVDERNDDRDCAACGDADDGE